jgi:hypothetical protein
LQHAVFRHADAVERGGKDSHAADDGSRLFRSEPPHEIEHSQWPSVDDLSLTHRCRKWASPSPSGRSHF